MEWIQSKQNARVKNWRKLHTAKGRAQQGVYLIEGTHLVEEAIRYQQQIEHVLVTQHYYEQMSNEWLTQVADRMIMLSDDVMQSVSLTEQPQGIIAIVEMPQQTTWQPTGKQYLLLDAVQDPGNIGTMIRTADAAGFDGVILGRGTADLYNDKVLRATQGSLWHIEVINHDLEDAIATLQKNAIPVYATALHQEALPYQAVSTQQAVALVVGNEGSGVSQAIIEQADQAIYIPMYGKAESLNVAIAAGILMFQFAQSH
ncbi:RNA methyltransferase [Aerococcaceae bacterium NML190073]|nr:RNA methyltransferase [Aerococcaceae bacterium NML190073]MCW6667522.1 RNA methyltransferase [Aerococcaceae bacterium NML190938]MCW6674581.1 RNA methyltransferase [Aerococcaceae bacterium NML171108]MCW6676493.1 RNA methyltransferase [Aerococcaceae bacterium NML180378]